MGAGPRTCRREADRVEGAAIDLNARCAKVNYTAVSSMAWSDAPAVPLTHAERRNQRNAVLAGFLGWTLDAFDFFILTLVIDDVAKALRRSRPQITLAHTLPLATHPI